MIIGLEFLQRIVLILAIGLIIGLERQRKSVDEIFSGVRTFILAGLFGLLSVYIGSIMNNYITVLIAFLTIGMLTAFGYFAEYKKIKSVGGTTEIAFLITFLIGVISYFDSYPFFMTIIVGLLTTLILASKTKLHTFSRTLTTKEVISAVVFATLTFLILPALPNYTVDPFGAINPYRTWLSLVLVLSVGFFSYMLMKIFGTNKGLLITGILGGIASSTAVAVSMAHKVRENVKLINVSTFAVLVASSIMFIRQFIWTMIVNFSLAPSLALRVVLVGIIGCILSYFYWKRKGGKENINVEIGSPLTYKPALRFTLVFIGVSVVASLIKDFSFTEVYILSFVSGLIDVDAITINLAQLSLSGLAPSIAVNGMLIAAVANTMTKWFLVNWLGTKKMMFEVGRIFIVLIALSGLLLMF